MKDFDLNNFLKFIENNEKKKDVVAVAVESTLGLDFYDEVKIAIESFTLDFDKISDKSYVNSKFNGELSKTERRHFKRHRKTSDAPKSKFKTEFIEDIEDIIISLRREYKNEIISLIKEMHDEGKMERKLEKLKDLKYIIGTTSDGKPTTRLFIAIQISKEGKNKYRVKISTYYPK